MCFVCLGSSTSGFPHLAVEMQVVDIILVFRIKMDVYYTATGLIQFH